MYVVIADKDFINEAAAFFYQILTIVHQSYDCQERDMRFQSYFID